MSTHQSQLELVDLAPLTTRVPLRNGNELIVYPMAADVIVYVVRRFADLQAILMSKEGGSLAEKLSVLGPQTIYFLTAVGLTDRHEFGTITQWSIAVEKESRFVEKKLSLAKQADIIEAMINCTFEDNPGPFFDKIRRWLEASGLVNLPQLGKVANSKVQTQESQESTSEQKSAGNSNGAMVTASTSQRPLSASFDMGGQKRLVGKLALAN